MLGLDIEGNYRHRATLKSWDTAPITSADSKI